jgi:hypothetical protein
MSYFCGIVVHKKQAKPTKNRASMIRSCSSKQLTLAEFDWPFQTVLDENNRWVKMEQCIPWDELAEFYYQGFYSQMARPAKDARMVIGAVIIKRELCPSDEETVLQIKENPYMQYFVGLSGYQLEAPFASSLFVEIRKRMGQSVFDGFHRVVVEAHDIEKAKKNPESEIQEELQAKQEEEPEDYSFTASENGVVIQKEAPTHQGKLIFDATVVEQAIRYPTDLSLLNEAREFSEQIIDILYTHATSLVKKPKNYREKARCHI